MNDTSSTTQIALAQGEVSMTVQELRKQLDGFRDDAYVQVDVRDVSDICDCCLGQLDADELPLIVVAEMLDLTTCTNCQKVHLHVTVAETCD
jgi:hypothetical protein